MKIEISDGILVPATDELKALVHKHYMYPVKHTEEMLTAVRYLKDTKQLKFPRDKQKFFSRIPLDDWEIIDKTIAVPVDKPIELSKGFSLRDYQEKPMADIQELHARSITDKVLQAGTSFGKSYTLTYYIYKLQLKTLILVDRNLLVEQMYNEIRGNSNADVQIVTKDTDRVADVNIVTLQLLARNPRLIKMFKYNIGSVVVDETHIIPANTFADILAQFPAKYRFGLSATPYREDGLTEIIYDLMGSTVVKANNPNNNALQYHVVECEEFFTFPDINQYKKAQNEFLQRPSVVDKVVSTIKFLLSKNRSILLSCDVVKTQEFYKDFLNKHGITAEILNSNSRKRDEIIERVESMETRVLIGLAVLEKGLSIKRLDTIVNLATLNKVKTTQLAGRLRREHDEKRQPIMIDFHFAGAFRKKNDLRYSTYLELKKTDNDKVLIFKSFEDYRGKWK